MTERQPDDLYDALRNRLEDYGQEPPAQLWAGIRAKLPPPVAQPQLRRRRRWSPALLLCLLLTVAGAASWNLWHKSKQSSSASKQPQLASSTNNSNQTNTLERGAGTSPATESSATGPAEAAGATPEQSDLAPTSRGSVAQQSPPAKAHDSAVLGTDAVAAEASSRSKKSRAESRRSRSYAAAIHGRREPAIRLGRKAISFSETDRGLGLSESKRATKTVARAALANDNSPDAAAESLRSAAGAVVASSQKESATVAGSGQAAGVTPPSDGDSSADATGGVAGSSIAAIGPASTSLLATRAVPLAVLPYPQPVVRAVLDSTRPLPAVAGRRWAALVLAGPALTHRLLYSGQKNYAAPYPLPTNGPTSRFATRDANSVAQEEKPAMGFGVQVQVRRVLNGRWAVSSGLGYQEYANRTTTTQASTYDFLNGSGVGVGASAPVLYVRQAPVQFTHRDTYRFLTVPVRFSYALGHPAGRFRYALLAGADAALYLGGSSPGPNGRIQTWDVANSPYRSLNASLSAGVEFRYRVASHWDVLAQPTGTFFLNALPRPTTSLTPRYLLGTGAQFGVSYDFR